MASSPAAVLGGPFYNLLGAYYTSPPSAWVVALSIFALVELVFWIYVRFFLSPRLNIRSAPPSTGKGETRTIELFMRVSANIHDHYCGERFLSKWFGGVPVKEIRLSNVKELLAWAAYGLHLEGLNDKQLQVVEENLGPLLSHLQVSAQPGFNPNIKCCRMTLEDLTFIHRPFVYYLGMSVLRALGNGALVLCGFRRMELKGMVYWYREGPASSTRPPLLFFHGISLGLSNYVQFMLPFAKGRTSLLFETPYITMTMAWERPTKQETVDAIDEICKLHRLGNVSVVGHSFGSIIAGWLASTKPWLVSQCVFVEPVCFLLCLPDVCYNFLYRQPRTFMEHLIHYFVATEMNTNYTLKRHFHWHENICLLEDLHCPVVIALASNDEVVPAEAVRQYAENVAKHKSPGGAADGLIELIWWSDNSHGQCLVSSYAVWEVASTTRKQEDRLGIRSRPYHVPSSSLLAAPGRDHHGHKKD